MAFGENNYKTNNWGAIIFYIFVFYMFSLAPTSINGKLTDVNQTIVDWLVLSTTLIISCLFFSKIDMKHFTIVSFIILYLFIISLISQQFNPSNQISLARIAPILCFLVLSFQKIKTVIPIRVVKLIVHIFMIIFLLWNCLIISDNEIIRIFTVNNYTQLYDAATSNMFIKSRPIMSFGIYTFAAYFYFLFFIIIYRLFKQTKKPIFFIYLISIFIMTMLLVANTSAIFSLLMFIYIYRSVKRKWVRLVAILFLLSLLYYILRYENIVDYYLESFNSKANGIQGRYMSEGSLMRNLLYVKENFYIGFNIVRNSELTYTDSGYIMYYLMGGFPFIIGMIFSFYAFIKRNLKSIFFLIFISTLAFEVALPILVYYKFIYAMLFLTISINSIDEYYKS